MRVLAWHLTICSKGRGGERRQRGVDMDELYNEILIWLLAFKNVQAV